jgi:hypothetical protein
MKFAKFGQVSEARDKWRAEQKKEDADPDEVAKLRAGFNKERERVKKSGKKIGIRDIQVDGNTLSADVKTVLFPVYNEFAKPGDREPILDLSAATGTAMILRSADNRLVIQHRAVSKQRLSEKGLSRGNASYNDIPGASVAGMLDASVSSPDRMPGTPDPIDTESIKGNILKEASEELGLAPEDMDTLRIVGVAQDKVKIHDELLLLADTKLDTADIRRKSRDSNRNRKLGEADFEEKFVDIPATSQAVETLLTDVKCPLPPTHYAAMVAAGYSLVLQESDAETAEQRKRDAEQWKKGLEPKMQANIDAMNQMVTAYYDKHPEALVQVPERFWGKRIPDRNRHGYTPDYSPEEQGLPNFEDEMTRTGLVPETRRQVSKAYLFDVDGVLSDPVEKQVTEHELYDQIISRLQQGQPVGLNTGRSNAWMVERFITPLLEKIDDKSILANFVAIGEKGGTWITFDGEGNMQHGRSSAVAVPENLKEQVKQLVIGKYGESMFFDDTKETMLSIEMRDGYADIEAFHAAQAELVNDLKELLQPMEQEDLEKKRKKSYKVDPTTIATDVESRYVGKALGADRFEEFLRDKGIKAEEYDTFGDSKSDLEMADELARRGKKVKMIYVGDSAALGDLQKEYPIDHVGGFSQGTLDYLSSN